MGQDDFQREKALYMHVHLNEIADAAVEADTMAALKKEYNLIGAIS
ncbi:hypothetical protein SLEP1_g28891 [Rubroshorea leprosula]|uniref:Uncharacterized protein n=1 Tax=Rubroshorea leprosula TaxID=152421 RepID=A0AAV5K685_9ROSI|nr:hypothetical protein SLEP1_g28891 [Rubroshorea leprosula]